MLELLIFLLLFVINAAISVFNAWSVGKSWATARAMGGWQRLVLYCAFIMAGCGFTWCFLIVLALAALALGVIDMDAMSAVLNLGYAAIILPMLGSGLAIWINSVAAAWRKRSFGSVGIAAWNTLAMANNAYSAATTLPQILGSLGSFFKGFLKGGSAKSKMQLLAILLVIMALVLGFLTAYVIVRISASSHSGVIAADLRLQRSNSAPGV